MITLEACAVLHKPLVICTLLGFTSCSFNNSGVWFTFNTFTVLLKLLGRRANFRITESPLLFWPRIWRTGLTNAFNREDFYIEIALLRYTRSSILIGLLVVRTVFACSIW